MNRHSNYQEKYLKYKSKYLELKKYGLNRPKYNMKGGALTLLPIERIPKIHDGSENVEQYADYNQFKTEVEALKSSFNQHKQVVGSATDKKVLTSKTNSTFSDIHARARTIALYEGRRLYTRWSQERSTIIGQILSNFDDNGDVLSTISADNKLFFDSATWFNDLYKWTMYPVMRYVEKQAKFGGKPIHVKFQVDIREPTVRNALKDPALQAKVFQALNKLKDRTFERDVFEQVSLEKKSIISDEDINAICFKNGEKRHLVQEVSDQQNAAVPEDGVVIRCFYKDDLYYDVPIVKEDGTLQQVGESGLLVIEAEGPWHLVTWLETSMMQCVYEAYHKHMLSSKGERAYQVWLSTALLRCATSVAYTRIMQICSGPTPALFTGRRTGGLPFLILQNLFFIDHFTQFVPSKMIEGVLTLQPPIPTIGLYKKNEDGTLKKNEEGYLEISENIKEATECLGTSSVDAVLYLRTLLIPPQNGETRELMKVIDPTQPNVLQFVGTHAHELSMVLSVLYHELDENPLQLPFSQVLGHYLYEELVRKKTFGPLPMLSDTLGTPAFVLAASLLLKDNCVFLSFVNSARQDSGDLVDFGTILDLIGYKGGCMASEIDDTATLLKASLLSKFNTFGAGGYFGDSNKVFNEKGVNISMAVKVVRVECTYTQVPISEQRPSNVTIDTKGDGTTICTGYPVKTGDPTDVYDIAGRQKISKFSADKLLSSEKLIKMRDDAIATRENAIKIILTPNLLSKVKQQICRGVITMNGDNLIIDTTPLQSLVSPL